MGKHADAEAFSRELASLKRDGCNVLVVSDAAGRDTACERLLGAPELDRRHVFLTTSTDVDSTLDRHAPRRTDAGSVGVIDATPGSYTRSAAAASASSALPGGQSGGLADRSWYDRVEDATDFEALLAASRDALDRVADGADAPGEVRFCIDSLDPLFDATVRDDVDEAALFHFLHALTSRIRATDGMGHAHVASDVDDDLLGTFEPLFDATIHVETDETGTVSQRWTLHESEYVSDWFEL